jgi:hypothetical protein
MYVTSAAWTDGLTIGGVDTHRDTHQGSCKVVNGRSELPIHRW